MAGIEAGVLRVAYEEHGDPAGWPVLLLHGFPYDVRAYDSVAAILAERGARAIVPWLRGYGPTRFLDPATPRSGEQAALGADLLALLDALGLERAVLAGYDWGGTAACVVAALWPDRVVGLVNQNGYKIQDIAAAGEPAAPETEHRFWYQYYFHSERGRAGLARNRQGIARLLWRLWSPEWDFDEATFAATAPSFDNPDFVEIVIHSYRHRFGLVPGDPAVAKIEARLARQPPIPVPAVTLEGLSDGVAAIEDAVPGLDRFTGPHRHLRIEGGGHNLPQEHPQAFADAVLALAPETLFPRAPRR